MKQLFHLNSPKDDNVSDRLAIIAIFVNILSCQAVKKYLNIAAIRHFSNLFYRQRHR